MEKQVCKVFHTKYNLNIATKCDKTLKYWTLIANLWGGYRFVLCLPKVPHNHPQFVFERGVPKRGFEKGLKWKWREWSCIRDFLWNKKETQSINQSKRLKVNWWSCTIYSFSFGNLEVLEKYRPVQLKTLPQISPWDEKVSRRAISSNF